MLAHFPTVTQSTGFQPEPLRWTVSDSDDDNDSRFSDSDDDYDSRFSDSDSDDDNDSRFSVSDDDNDSRFSVSDSDSVVTQHSPLNTKHSLLTAHHSLLIAHYSLLTTQCVPEIFHLGFYLLFRELRYVISNSA